MMEASLNLCKRMENQARDFLKQLAENLELVLLIFDICFILTENIFFPFILTEKKYF